MRFELFDAAVHLCGVLVEKYLDRPYRAGEDIEKHVFNAYTAELLVECLASVQAVGRNDGAFLCERCRHSIFDVRNTSSHKRSLLEFTGDKLVDHGLYSAAVILKGFEFFRVLVSVGAVGEDGNLAVDVIFRTD